MQNSYTPNLEHGFVPEDGGDLFRAWGERRMAEWRRLSAMISQGLPFELVEPPQMLVRVLVGPEGPRGPSL